MTETPTSNGALMPRDYDEVFHGRNLQFLRPH
jgi:hypothetical protein